MKIAVIGTGNVGSKLAEVFRAGGHEVIVGSRGQATSPAEAAAQADVVVLALPFPAAQAVVEQCGGLKGKIVIDVTNPVDAQLDVTVPPAGSAGEQIAQWAPQARVVKAFNTIGAALMGDSTFDGFYCGDDAAAKQTVRELIAGTGMRPEDVGPLRQARYLEQLAGLWISLAVKGRVKGAFGFNLVRKS